MGLALTACGAMADWIKVSEAPDGKVSYINGANIAGFVQVADAMLAQGVT